MSRVLDFKQALVEITELPSKKSMQARELYKLIQQYKKELNKYERESNDWLHWREEIQRLRGLNQKDRKIYISIKVTLKDWSKYSWTTKIELYRRGDYQTLLRKQIKETINYTVRSSRVARRHNITTDSFGLEYFEFYGKKDQGRVFVHKNQIIKAYIKKNGQKLYDDKKPTTLTKYVGVEIEFCAPIEENDLAYQLFRRGFQKYVQLKHDGSLRPLKDEHGYEFAMLFTEKSFRKDLKKVTDFLAEIKAVAIDRRCGLHVHLDMRKRDKDLVFHNFVACQNALWNIVDPRRYDSEFCRVVYNRKFPTSFNGRREERYKTINAAAYFRHQTLEIRMHEGSIDFNHITNWIDVLIKIANYKKKLKNNVSRLTTLKEKFKIDPKVYKSIIEKSCHWQINYTDDTREMLDRIDNNRLNTRDAARVQRVRERIQQLDRAGLEPLPDFGATFAPQPVMVPMPRPTGGAGAEADQGNRITFTIPNPFLVDEPIEDDIVEPEGDNF